MEEVERIRILGTPVDVVTMESALAGIDELIQRGIHSNYVLAVNPEKVFAIKKNRFLKEMFEKAELLIPDGIGIVLSLRLLYGKKIGRVPGAELMPNLCRLAMKRGYKVFVYGAKEEANKKAVKKLQIAYPGLNIVGRCNGYVAEERMGELLSTINRAAPDILFVALGSPKQEEWIHRYLSRLDVKICQGIGGTLDTIAGNVKRAPAPFCRVGLEWFYRLLKDPKRIRRQKVLPIFVARLLMQKLGFCQ
jgi:N-acetylglucosaminyldiphosphoundecaprenol N-acetyl-beta-D-mannosaminyltransferase